jgi:hypothetical protein
MTRNRRRLDVDPERCQGSYMDGRARRKDEVGRHIIKISQYISYVYSYFIKKNATKKVHICKYMYICYLTCLHAAVFSVLNGTPEGSQAGLIV